MASTSMIGIIIIITLFLAAIIYLEIDAYLERRDERQGKGRYHG